MTVGNIISVRADATGVGGDVEAIVPKLPPKLTRSHFAKGTNARSAEERKLLGDVPPAPTEPAPPEPQRTRPTFVPSRPKPKPLRDAPGPQTDDERRALEMLAEIPEDFRPQSADAYRSQKPFAVPPDDAAGLLHSLVTTRLRQLVVTHPDAGPISTQLPGRVVGTEAAEQLREDIKRFVRGVSGFTERTFEEGIRSGVQAAVQSQELLLPSWVSNEINSLSLSTLESASCGVAAKRKSAIDTAAARRQSSPVTFKYPVYRMKRIAALPRLQLGRLGAALSASKPVTVDELRTAIADLSLSEMSSNGAARTGNGVYLRMRIQQGQLCVSYHEPARRPQLEIRVPDDLMAAFVALLFDGAEPEKQHLYRLSGFLESVDDAIQAAGAQQPADPNRAIESFCGTFADQSFVPDFDRLRFSGASSNSAESTLVFTGCDDYDIRLVVPADEAKPAILRCGDNWLPLDSKPLLEDAAALARRVHEINEIQNGSRNQYAETLTNALDTRIAAARR